MRYKITEQEIEKLYSLSKQEKNAKQKRRYDVVIAHFEGHNHALIAEMFHVSSRMITQCVSDYKKNGFEGLILKKSSGRPKHLTDKQEKELYDTIATMTPEEAGLGIFANWTASLACHFVKEKYGVIFSERGMRNLFERIGLSYTRPTYTLEKADPEKQEAFKEHFEQKKQFN